MASAARYLRPEVIAQVQRLDLRARFIVEGFLSGLHSSPFHGFSVEFSEHRKYVPGDDLRMIDYSVLARTDRYYIKKYEAETNLEAHVVVDTSRSMEYPRGSELERSGRMSKLEYAICLAAALAYLMIHQQDAVGLACVDRKLRTFVPAGSKGAHLVRLIGMLASAAPHHDEAGKGLGTALHDLAQRIHKRGLFIILSDLLMDPRQVLEGLHHLRFRGHNIIVFQVLDWTEVEFPFEQLARFKDPETGSTLIADPRAMRDAYLKVLRDFTEQYRYDTGSIGAEFVQVNTGMTFDRALVEFLANRRRRF